MCLFVLCVACLTVFVNCLVKQFAMCLGVVAILLLNVMDVFSVCWCWLLCWIDHVWSSKECVCCACDPNERLSAPSYVVLCFVCRKLSPHLGFDSCITGVCSPYVISLCDFAYYVFRARACSCYASCP